MTNPNGNPFAGGKSNPAVSWRGVPIGTTVKIVVTDWPELVQESDYETREKAFWPDGNPKMAVVINGTVDGDAVSLWASKPSSLYAAIGAAQDAANAEVGPGGTLAVTLIGEQPSSKGAHLNPAKQFSATYAPANAFAKVPAAAPTAAPAATPAPPAPVAPPAAPASTGKPVTAEQYAALANAGVDMTPFTIV